MDLGMVEEDEHGALDDAVAFANEAPPPPMDMQLNAPAVMDEPMVPPPRPPQPQQPQADEAPRMPMALPAIDDLRMAPPRPKRHPGRRPSPRRDRRQFAFRRRSNRKPNDRVEFADTVFWAAGLQTNEEGVVEVSFDLSDSVTSFRVEVDGVSTVGSQLGSFTMEFSSVEPFYARLQLPMELTDGDSVLLPVTTVVSALDPRYEPDNLALGAHASRCCRSLCMDT